MTSAEPAPRVLITSAMITAAQDCDAAGRPRDRSWHRVPADQAARLLAGAWPLITAAERERITALLNENAAELSDHGVQGASAASMTSAEPPPGPLDAITEAANAFLDALGSVGLPGGSRAMVAYHAGAFAAAAVRAAGQAAAAERERLARDPAVRFARDYLDYLASDDIARIAAADPQCGIVDALGVVGALCASLRMVLALLGDEPA